MTTRNMKAAQQCRGKLKIVRSDTGAVIAFQCLFLCVHFTCAVMGRVWHSGMETVWKDYISSQLSLSL